MEIEAKFNVPDPGVFQRLLSLTRVGEYAVKEPASKTLTDYYLDTAEGLIRRGGFACRVRNDLTRGTWIGTLKGLGEAQGAVHQRQELEIPIAPHATPDRWPESPARALALSLSRGRPLAELFAVDQVRHTRDLERDGRRTAELSLDEVVFRAGDQQAASLELEIELKAAGALDDLHALIGALSGYGLQPEPRSKFERGLALLLPPFPPPLTNASRPMGER